MKNIHIILILGLLFISSVYAGPYISDEDMDMWGNDIYNATYINGTYIYQNGVMAITSELDPHWSGNQSLYSTTSTIVGFGYYNSSDFVITDYRLDSWDNFTGIPTATPSNGDTTHLSTADQIYDWVIGLGYSTTVGTVTSIATGTGIGGGTITSSGTLTVAGGTCLTADADGLSVTGDCIGNTQLEYDTGQALTTTSDVKFDDINMTGNLTFQTGFGVCYNADCSDYKMYNGTCEITVIGTTTLNVCE